MSNLHITGPLQWEFTGESLRRSSNVTYHYTMHIFTFTFTTHHKIYLAVHQLDLKLSSCLAAIYLCYHMHRIVTNPIAMDTWASGEALVSSLGIIPQWQYIIEIKETVTFCAMILCHHVKTCFVAVLITVRVILMMNISKIYILQLNCSISISKLKFCSLLKAICSKLNQRHRTRLK